MLAFRPSVADDAARAGLRPVDAVTHTKGEPVHITGGIDSHERDIVQAFLSRRVRANCGVEKTIPPVVDLGARSCEPASRRRRVVLTLTVVAVQIESAIALDDSQGPQIAELHPRGVAPAGSDRVAGVVIPRRKARILRVVDQRVEFTESTRLQPSPRRLQTIRRTRVGAVERLAPARPHGGEPPVKGDDHSFQFTHSFLQVANLAPNPRHGAKSDDMAALSAIVQANLAGGQVFCDLFTFGYEEPTKVSGLRGIRRLRDAGRHHPYGHGRNLTVSLDHCHLSHIIPACRMVRPRELRQARPV